MRSNLRGVKGVAQCTITSPCVRAFNALFRPCVLDRLPEERKYEAAAFSSDYFKPEWDHVYAE